MSNEGGSRIYKDLNGRLRLQFNKRLPDGKMSFHNERGDSVEALVERARELGAKWYYDGYTSNRVDI